MGAKGTKMSKNAKTIALIAFLLLISVAVVVTMTLSKLSDSKTAQGTITFNLANYQLQVLGLDSTSSEVILPGKTAKANTIKLKNTADNSTGTTAGMGGVYIKLEVTGISIGVTEYAASALTLTNETDYIKVSATGTPNTESIVTIKFKKQASTTASASGLNSSGSAVDTYWVAGTGANAKNIYLSSNKNSLSYAKLAFTDRNAAEKTISIEVEMTGVTPNEYSNGFNNTKNPTIVGMGSQYSGGMQIKVKYKAYWQTTAWA